MADTQNRPGTFSIHLQALPFAMPYTVLLILAVGSTLGGIYIFIPFFFLVALGDLFFGLRTANLDVDTPSSNLVIYSFLTWLWVPLQITTVLYVFYQVLVVDHLSLIEIVAVTVIAGKTCVAGIGVAHELIHRPVKWERWLGEILLTSFAFAHYRTEHVYVHHTHVGTPLDPVFARKGQTSWSFLVRGFFGNILKSWQFERNRLHRRGRSMWHISNPFYRYSASLLVWLVIFWLMGGATGIVLYFSYSIFAVVLLRLVDYVEHYGLTRQKLPNGRYERVLPQHSWNTSLRVSNWAMWNVQRHSDHHHKAIRAFPLLQHFDETIAPQLPFNYVLMIMQALIPPLWFRRIDPLVDEWRKRFYPDVENWRAYDSKLYFTHPTKFHLVDEIATRSSRLADWAEMQPILLDSLEVPEFTNLSIPDDIGLSHEELTVARRGLVRLYYLQEFDANEIYQRTIESDDIQSMHDIADEARAWTNTKAFQTGMNVVRGNFAPVSAQSVLSDILEACIRVFALASTDQVQAFGDDGSGLTSGNFAVVAFGALGRREVHLDSTIDLALVYDAQHDDLEMQRTYNTIARRFFAAVGSFAHQNMLVAKLNYHFQPQAKKAVAWSIAELEQQVVDDTSGSECLRLVDARAVCGDDHVMASFRELKTRLLQTPPIQQRAQASMYGTMQSTVLTPPEPNDEYLRDLVDLSGGYNDLRLLTAYWRLQRIASTGEDVETTSIFAEEDDTLPDRVTGLHTAMLLWHNLEGMLRWTLGAQYRDRDLPSSDVWRKLVADGCEMKDFEELVNLAHQSQAFVAHEIQRIARDSRADA